MVAYNYVSRYFRYVVNVSHHAVQTQNDGHTFTSLQGFIGQLLQLLAVAEHIAQKQQDAADQQEAEIEHELVNVFAAVGSYELRPDLDEVDEGRWWELADIDASLGKGVFTPNFESEFQMIRTQLLALL